MFFRFMTVFATLVLSLTLTVFLVGCNCDFFLGDDDDDDESGGDDDGDDDDADDDADDDDDDDLCTGFILEQRGTTQICDPAGVRVVFSVADCDGSPVGGITDSDFEVINDETGQPFQSEGGSSTFIEALDFEFYSILVLDLSYSIIENNCLNDVLNGARTFINAMLENQVEDFQHSIAIYVFGSTEASELVHEFSKDVESLYAVIEELREDEGRGSTNLYGAFTKGLDLVEDEGSGGLIARSLVIMTDGTHETGDRETMRDYALARLENSDVNSFSIGIRGDYNEQDIRELASSPENFFLVDNASDLVDAFEELSELMDAWSRSNYVMGVCSPLEGSNRSLTIQIQRDDLYGELEISYSAVGFNLVGCDSEAIARGEGCHTYTPEEPPIISNAYWEAAAVADVDFTHLLVWSVCDPDDDLSGGQIFAWLAGTSIPFFGDYLIYWDDFDDGPPSAPDCDNPHEIGGIPVDFTGLHGYFCADLEVTDGAGHLSNKLRDICVNIQ